MKKFLVASFVLVACGDNGSVQTDAHISIDTPPTIDATPAIPKAVAVGGDFSTKGELSALNTSSLYVSQNLVAAAVTDDPQLRHLGDKLYIINRDTNNITVLDDSTYALVGQMATGAGSNPQDVAVVGTKLYVPALGTAGVVVGTLGGSTTTIDLGGASGVNDPDGKPDCVGAYAVGTDVYVVCEDLNNFVPRGNGVLVVIDSGSDTIRTVVTLPVANPQGFIKALGAHLIVSTYDSPAGCTIEVVPGTTPTATCLTQNADLGGTPISFDVSGTKIWFAYATGTFPNQILYARSFDTGTSTYAANLTPSTQLVQDVAACPNGKIAVTDATMNAAGLRLYSATGTELTTSAQSIGIGPVFGDGLVCY
jgi:hypothetical protein